MDEEEIRDSTAVEGAVSDIIDENMEKDDTVASDASDRIISSIIAALDERLETIGERLGAIERAQRDTFAHVVQSAAIVSSDTSEVDDAAPTLAGDYDLEI